MSSDTLLMILFEGGFFQFRPFFLLGLQNLELVKNRTGIEQRFYELCKTVVEKENLELYALDYISGQSLLRLYIQDKETKTAQLEDCVKVDRAMTEYVDQSDWMPESLTLEVSSPGVYREIKEAKFFEECVGERVCLSLSNKICTEDFVDAPGADDLKGLTKDKKIICYIFKYEESSILVGLNKSSEKLAKVEFENIKKANIEPLWDDIKES